MILLQVFIRSYGDDREDPAGRELIPSQNYSCGERDRIPAKTTAAIQNDRRGIRTAFSRVKDANNMNAGYCLLFDRNESAERKIRKGIKREAPESFRALAQFSAIGPVKPCTET